MIIETRKCDQKPIHREALTCTLFIIEQLYQSTHTHTHTHATVYLACACRGLMKTYKAQGYVTFF